MTPTEKPQREAGEAEIDRDAARLFLRQPVGVDSGERFDQGGLAVINVTGGRENEMPHACFVVRHAVKAATTSSSCFLKIVRRSSWNWPCAR
jgi:hypothetical protein